MDSEIWKPIEGFEGYEVSSAARDNKRGRCYPKYVAQYTMDGELLRVYNSTEEAARAIGKPGAGGNIRHCARGKGKQSLGFRWKYVDHP